VGFLQNQKTRKILYVIFPQLVIAGIILGFIFNMVIEENGIEKLENFSEDLENDDLSLIIPSMVVE
jgi:hypothetical protein